MSNIVLKVLLPKNNQNLEKKNDRRLNAANQMRENGGLLSTEIENQFTAEAAISAGLPLKKFKISDLVVHPYNVRPKTGSFDLEGLREQLRREGQLDPIHVVPYQDGFAIMEGQRRWLAAPGAGLSELLGWEHPPLKDPFDVYAFGQMIHESRRDATAYDKAVVWGRMIDDGLFTTAAELAVRAGLDTSTVHKSLSILKAPPGVLHEIQTSPMRFSDRHLYALAQINTNGGAIAATEAARSVALAPEDKPMSARKLEALAAAFEKNGTAPSRGRRKNSVPIVIRSATGAEIGALKAFRDGRMEFKPVKPLPERVAERLTEAVKLVFATELQAHFESGK